MLQAALEAAITTLPRLLMGGLDDDVGNGEHRALQSGGQADAQDHPQTAAVHAQPARLKADVLAGAQQAAEQQSRAEGIA